MCWVTTNPDYFMNNIADNDLTVYKIVKIVDEKVISYFQEFEYEFNKLYKTKLNIHKESYNRTSIMYIDKGFHSYFINKDLIKWIHFEPSTEIVIGTDHYELDEFTKIIKCTIPKNSIYFVNKFNDVVSNEIILNEVISF